MLSWINSNTDDDSKQTIIEFIDSINIASWYAVVVSTGFWALTYFTVKYTFHNKSPEWCIRLVALFHGLGTVIRGIPECIHESGEWAFENPEEESSKNQMFIIVISLGYFVFDLGWCLAYETETNLMILHHIYSCVALYRVLISEISGGQAACGLGAMEMTNPFLQLRWFLRSEGYSGNVVFKFIEFIFITLFFFIRIVLGTYFFNIIIRHNGNTYEQKISAIMIYILSWLFFANISKFVYLKYVKQCVQYIDQCLRQST